MPNNWIWYAIAAAAAYFLFLKKGATTATGPSESMDTNAAGSSGGSMTIMPSSGGGADAGGFDRYMDKKYGRYAKADTVQPSKGKDIRGGKPVIGGGKTVKTPPPANTPLITSPQEPVRAPVTSYARSKGSAAGPIPSGASTSLATSLSMASAIGGYAGSDVGGTVQPSRGKNVAPRTSHLSSRTTHTNTASTNTTRSTSGNRIAPTRRSSSSRK